jgi:HlyD family secretion protein
MSDAPMPRCHLHHLHHARTLLPCAVLSLILAGCSWSHASTAVLSHYTVHPSDLDITIEVEGELKSSKPALIVSQVSGKILSIVPEGSTVKKGELLMELENHDLASELTNDHEDIESSKRLELNAERELQLQKLDSQKQIGDTDTTLAAAIMGLDEYVKGKASLQEQDLNLAVDKAVSELTDAEERCARMPVLLQKGFVTLREKRSAELDMHEKLLAVDHKKREMEIFKEYEFPTAKAKLDSELLNARLARDRLSDQMATQLAQKQADIDKAKELIAQATRKFELASEQAKGLRMLAPHDGIVIYGNSDQNFYGQAQGDPYQIGSQVNQGQTVMSIPDLSAMEAKVLVNELDVNKISVGQVTISQVGSLENRRFTGTIVKISTTSQQNWMAEAKNYETTVSLGDISGAPLRPGITVKTEIHIAHLSMVMHVPVELVYAHDTEHYCWIRKTGGSLEYRVLTLGQSNDSQVVVTSGLTEGEELVMPEIEPERPPVTAMAKPLDAPAVAGSGR